jgi:ubiquinone/menaquinone biosynthesis C-methylase UbiE
MYLRYALALTEARGKVVLDLCCGMGWGTYLLGARARTSLGVDIDSAAIHAARTLFGGESTVFVRGNARAIPLPDQSVGLVTAMECVEHMTEEELTECLHEVRRILKPQGRLIGSSFFPVNEDERRGVLANPSHCLALAPSEMTRFLRGAFSWARVFHNRMFFVAQR